MTSCVSRASPSQCLTSVYYPIRCSPEGCRGRVWRGEGKRKMGKWPCLKKTKTKKKKLLFNMNSQMRSPYFRSRMGDLGVRKSQDQCGPCSTWLARGLYVLRQPESPVAPRSHPRPLHMRCLLIGLLQEWECNACIRSGRSQLGTSALGKAAFMD